MDAVFPKIIQKITEARAIVEGKPEMPELSFQGYGLGWFRDSYRGYDVSSGHVVTNHPADLHFS